LTLVVTDGSALQAICGEFGVGVEIEVRAELHGGVNRVWRVQTDHGQYAVHQLLGLPPELDILERCAWVASLELAAVAAGVHAPAPVLIPSSGAAALVMPGLPGAFTIHEWHDAPPATSTDSSEAFAASLGDAIARIHSLDHPGHGAIDVLDRRPTSAEWKALASRAEAAGLSWAASISDAAGDLEAALRTLDDWDTKRSAPQVSSHRDLTSANLLNDGDVAVLIDWESAGPITTSAEIGRTALDNFLTGDSLEPGLLSAFLNGYAAIRPLPPIDLPVCQGEVRHLRYPII
jgi:Ser/Thr protein kinase RdoA (MazF antagonist)